MKVEYEPIHWVHPEEAKPKRKVIQLVDLSHIKVDSPGLYKCALAALCDDGTIWVFEAREKRWHKIKDVPQTGAEEDDNTGFVVL